MAFGTWGQRWIESELSLQHLDAPLLMWDMHRSLDITPLPKRRSVIQFQYADAPKGRRVYWLVVDPGGGVDLCMVDPGFDVDLYVSCSLRTMTAIWMGFETVPAAVAAKELMLVGNRDLKSNMQKWLGLSPFAKVRTSRELGTPVLFANPGFVPASWSLRSRNTPWQLRRLHALVVDEKAIDLSGIAAPGDRRKAECALGKRPVRARLRRACPDLISRIDGEADGCQPGNNVKEKRPGSHHVSHPYCPTVVLGHLQLQNKWLPHALGRVFPHLGHYSATGARWACSERSNTHRP